MNHSFSLTISLPARHLLTFEAKQLRFPASDGYVGILANRKPLIASMGPGLLHIVDIADEDYWFATTGGFCEMCDNQAVLLCDSLVCPEDVDVSEERKPFIHQPTDNFSEKQKIDYVTRMLADKLFQLQRQQQEKAE